MLRRDDGPLAEGIGCGVACEADGGSGKRFGSGWCSLVLCTFMLRINIYTSILGTRFMSS